MIIKTQNNTHCDSDNQDGETEVGAIHAELAILKQIDRQIHVDR